ncbi:MAG: GNAT family N-acetyltransferase [Magnetospirillum sp.]|nr:GNAT family N-acetyltransferase [Magnetospirillum sp.]
MLKVAIVPFDAADRDAVATLVVAIQRDEFGVPITYEQQPDLQDPIAFFCRDGGGFWTAKTDGGDIVGTIGLTVFAPGQAALRKMFVHADYRGRAHGVAQILLDTLLSHARATNLASVWLGTTEFFKAAHRFYAKNDFAEVDAAQLPPSFPRMTPDTRFFRIDL